MPRRERATRHRRGDAYLVGGALDALSIVAGGGREQLALVEPTRYTSGMATVTEQLRAALKRCGETRADVSRATGIPESVLSRFARGATFRGENLDTLAAYLRLELRAKVRKKAKAGGRRR